METIIRQCLVRLEAASKAQGGNINIMPDEFSETAQQWLAELKQAQALNFPDIPFIDEDLDETSEPKQTVVRANKPSNKALPRLSISDPYFTIMARKASILEQAEARIDFKRNNSVKKSMVMKLSKSFESLALKKSSIRKSDKKCNDQVVSSNNELSVDMRKGSLFSAPVSSVSWSSMSAAVVKWRQHTADPRRRMTAEWNKSYTDMCSRAQRQSTQTSSLNTLNI